MGITGPHITTKERAKTLADACRFAPRGKRSYGSSRGANYGRNNSTAEYMESFNSQVIVIAQLEDIEVLDNIDSILSVDGIDYYSSGAQDIAQSMNLPGQPNHPKVKEFESEIRNRVHTAGGKMVDAVMDLVRINEVIIDAAITHLSKAKSPK
jgi:2-keto-3-deoxy-L-rhamnonate aldolase RhmA